MNSEPNKPDNAIGDADYSEKHDIASIHSAASREETDPSDGNEPLSLWMVITLGLVLFFGGLYLGRYSGDFRMNEYTISGGSAAAAGAGEEEAEEKPPTLAEQGEKVYRQNCVACHQASGLGLPGAFPPLAGAEWVTGSEQRAVAIILKGLTGPVEVAGSTYNGVMQPWDTSLTDKKIAAVTSYIRTAWGNTASEVTPAQVATARKLFKSRKTAWTAAELLEIPDDATLDGGSEAGGDTSAAPSGDAAEKAAPSLVKKGEKVYKKNCVACHQPTGLGLPGAFPSLVGTEWVTGSENRILAILLDGLVGPIEIDGMTYNSVMQPWKDTLNDEEIAAVASYIRTAWGNSASEISEVQVVQARELFQDRKESWTVDELLKIPAD